MWMPIWESLWTGIYKGKIVAWRCEWQEGKDVGIREKETEKDEEWSLWRVMSSEFSNMVTSKCRMRKVLLLDKFEMGGECQNSLEAIQVSEDN